MSDPDTIDQRVIVCPHCGHRHDDSHDWGIFGPHNDEEGRDVCGECCEDINWSRKVVITYTTKKPKPEEVQG